MKLTAMRAWGSIAAILLILGGLKITAIDADEREPNEITYEFVKIGKQEWMAKNLNVGQFRNGDLIAEARSRTEWQEAYKKHEPVWSYYDYDPENGRKYGKLYNWYAVVDPRGLAPIGWHVPSDAEWTELTEFLGGEAVAGGKLKYNTGWLENGNGSNQSCFSGLPGGACAADGYLGSAGYLGVWWTATPDRSYYYDKNAHALYRDLYYSRDSIGRHAHSKGNGFSVRCIKD